MPSPLFVLLTDFGAGSGYPAQVKGVLLSRIPDARIVDLSHEVPAYDVLAGALLLEAGLPWFPADAIAIAVVDPGVGTARRALLAVTAEGRRLIAPDNGLVTPFLVAGTSTFAITPGGAVPHPRSATFHGRDLFAPVAAHLAQGGAPGSVGPAIPDPVRLAIPATEVRDGEIAGTVLAADGFGNLVTSIRETDLGAAEVASVLVGDRTARWVHTFGEGAPGELLAMIGSGGRVELALREGSAARSLGATRDLPVHLVLSTRR